MPDARVRDGALSEFTIALLTAMGADTVVAHDVAFSLVETSLCGVDTHGIVQLPRIVDRVRGGRSQVRERARLVVDDATRAVAVVDAALTPGQHSALAATRIAADRATQFGIGMATVRNSTHLGAMVPYLRLLEVQKLAGAVGSNSLRSMAAFGVRRANLGNNPFGFVAPAGSAPAFLFDSSSAVMSFGRRAQILRDGGTVPDGAFITPDAPSDEAGVCEIADSLEQVAMPFGGHKGAAGAVWVEVLSGLLSGGHVGAATETAGADGFRGPSHYVWAVDPTAFGVPDFEHRARSFLEGLGRGADVRLPGARLAEERARRLRDGIPCPSSLIAALDSLRREFGSPALDGVS